MNERQGEQTREARYLACEHKTVYLLLMIISGMMGAYTFTLRGGVFCNAQTANIVMMAISLGRGNFSGALYYLIPITAYALGAFVSEALPSPIKRWGLLRWDTCLIAIEMVVFCVMGFLPLSLPHQIVQVTINFIASMQYNTFRQAEGVPMATTFCTNHVRQIGIALAKMLRGRNVEKGNRAILHAEMIAGFMAGCALLTISSEYLREKSIWLVLLPLLIVFSRLVYADLVVERHLLHRKPAGH